MNWTIRTKLGAGYLLGVGLFISLILILRYNISQIEETNQWVTHTHTVMEKADQLYSAMADMQRGMRGYVIAGDDEFLSPYYSGKADTAEILVELKSLTQDNPEQQAKLDAIASRVSERISYTENIVSLRKNEGEAAAAAVVAQGSGNRLMEEFREALGGFKKEEERLLGKRVAAVNRASQISSLVVLSGIGLTGILLGAIFYLIARSLLVPIGGLTDGVQEIGRGNLGHRIDATTRDELGVLAGGFNQMAKDLQSADASKTEEDWLKTQLARISVLLQGQREIGGAMSLMLSEMAALLRIQYGAYYALEERDGENPLRLRAGFGLGEAGVVSESFKKGEGLVGQCAIEKRKLLLTDVPAEYIRIVSGLMDATPASVCILPILFENEVLGIIELASLQNFTSLEQRFLDDAASLLGPILHAIRATEETEKLLKKTQEQAEELRAQGEEMTAMNAQLVEKTRALEASEEELRAQQEELKAANEELEERANQLAEKNQAVERKNAEVELARRMMEEKAEQLALTSKYKSEFLANMSHELRTPLNSLLILARLLSDNAETNLTPKQVEYAKTIHESGTDLLELINDILDLAKIESGTQSVEVNDVRLDEIRSFVERTFRQIANEKKVNFELKNGPNLPRTIRTDGRRLEQVLKNLLSNAFKFTEQGSVSLQISAAASGWNRETETLSSADMVLSFAVSDTGIGIPKEKQKIIFEAFQQAESGTARKYGGTGLGLSISREIVAMLGGELHLNSEPGRGSVFTVYLPAAYRPTIKQAGAGNGPGQLPSLTLPFPRPSTAEPRSAAGGEKESPRAAPEIADDRHAIGDGDRILLVVEDDPRFAAILLDLARQHGFKVVIASSAAQALEAAREVKPTAITLDLRLPDWDGWAVLDRFKRDPLFRHIPVHVISVDDAMTRALRSGAYAFLKKPVSKESLDTALENLAAFSEKKAKKLLVVEDHEAARNAIVELIGNGDVEVTAISTGEEAIEALAREKFDCMVLDLNLPGISGVEVINRTRNTLGQRELPIIIYTGKDLSRSDETELARVADAIIIKGVKSPERLLDETSIFLHRVQAHLPAAKRRMIEDLHRIDTQLAGRKTLIVDDDIRNIFSLTTLLEGRGMKVVYAENGADAINILEQGDDIEIVLMDIMMPGMDGYETMRVIRQNPKFAKLPILALTAKAMKGDREKCIEAGASDYVTKPVDVDQLLSLLRVWLYR